MGQNAGHHARGAGQVGQAGQALAALRMHQAGNDYRTIAAALGVGKSTIARWISDALDAPQKALERAARDYRAESHRLLDAVVDANLDLAGTPGNGNLLVRTIETRARMEGLMAAPIPQPRAAAEEWQVVIADYETGEMVDANTGEVITPARNPRKAITE